MSEHLTLVSTSTEGALWQVEMPYKWIPAQRVWMAGPCETCGAFGLVVDDALSWPVEHVHHCYRPHKEDLETATYDEAWE